MAHRQFPCIECGAELKFAPGTDALQCPYCGTENEIAASDVVVEELDFREHLAQVKAGQETYEVVTIRCSNCGAETTFDENITSDECAFCGTPHVQEQASTRLIKPQAVLPFKIDNREARERYKKWLQGLWFAPNKLKEYARREGGLNGMYIPHWTYDANTTTRYVGQRGEYYYVSESYTTVENGQTVTRTRQVRKTRWYSASGVVYNTFDDVLVVASTSLPRKYMQKLEPWDLEAVAPYTDEYLSGFRTESYTVDLEAGFEIATQRMEPTIDSTIRSDIGGDEQRILSKDIQYHDVTFKHLLLPVWISAYRYQDKIYRFMVNARTGQVSGERPWSWVKITLAVLAAILVIVVIVVLLNQ
ncbi:MAG: hypothetical protein ACE5G0_17600 [Rhodothermales bacterium]